MERYWKRLREWWRAHTERFLEHPWQDRSRREKLTTGLPALTYLTTREVFRDRAPMMAASLSFFTVLAIVPLLTVAASLMAGFGLLGQEGGVLFDTLHQVFPDAAGGIASYLGEMATDSAQAVGGIGAITLLIIGLVLFNVIEETLTRIWRGAHDRSVIVKMLTFYAMITFGPVLIALSIVHTASAQLYLTQLGIDVSFFNQLIPVGYGLVAFTLLYKLVPNSVVRWRAALVGGLYAAVAFELAKWGFNLYVNQLLFHTYDRVYGALSLIPIGLLWVYITWLVILIGAELSYAFQHLPELIRGKAGRRHSEARPSEFLPVHPVVALELLTPVLEAFQQGEGPVGEKQLAAATGLPDYLIRQVLQVWQQEGIVISVGGDKHREMFVPGRPPEKMAVRDLIEPFWIDGGSAGEGKVAALSQGYWEATRAFFGERTARELVGEESETESRQADEKRGELEEPATDAARA